MTAIASDGLDPITVEVIRNKLDGIANEMGIKLIRSSFSPMVKEAFDAAASLFTREGEVLAQAMSVPGHLSALMPIVRQLLKSFPLSDAKEGDVYILNDPYMGGTHIPDIGMMMPIFHAGDVVALSATISHHQDLGGMVAGSLPTTATELFQEGLRIPPLKYRDTNGEDRTFVAILRKNVRFPDTLMGDLNAQLASCVVGARRIHELADTYGSSNLDLCFKEILDRSERMTRQALRRIPDGTYRYTETIDNDGVEIDKPIRIAVAVTVRDGALHVDFEGTSTQVKGPLNCVPAAATAPVYFAIRAVSGEQIPTNGGCFRSVTLNLPRGSLVNPIEPAPVNSRTATLKRIAVCVLGALRQALPDEVPADAASELLILIFGGSRDDKSRYITGELVVGGGGAASDLDGVDVIDTDNTNCMNIPVETLEMDAPVRVHRFGLVPDSGGAGQQRGGLGVVREYEILEGRAVFTHRGERHFFPAKGFRGGRDGALARSKIIKADGSEIDIPSKMVVEVERGDRIVVQTAGGAGYGDPGRRDPKALREDLANGKVTTDAAADVWSHGPTAVPLRKIASPSMAPWTAEEIARARAETPALRDRIHLNSCGTGAMPPSVLEAVVEHLQREAAEGGYEAANARRVEVEAVYADVGALLGATAEDIALFDSATSAWQALFASIVFRPGDRILTGRSEYASNMMAFLRARDLHGVEIDVAPDGLDGILDAEAAGTLAGPRTRLVALTHVPTNRGAIAPVVRMGEIARGVGALYLLDACQSVGQMPIDVRTIGCDMLTAAGRKFLRGPRGTGFAYVGPEARARLQPTMVDIQSGTWIAPDRYQIRADARRFERWERSVANVLGLGVAVRYARCWSLERIGDRIQMLADFARTELGRIPGVCVHDKGRRLAGIVCFTVENVGAEDVVAAAGAAGINISRSRIVDARYDLEAIGAQATCRLAPHYFNEPEDITALVVVLGALAERTARSRPCVS